MAKQSQPKSFLSLCVGSIVSKDIKCVVDLLQTFDDVNPDRIGITGVSFGGEMAATYAALDERIKVIVFQGFGGETGIKQGINGADEDQPHLCDIIPGYSTYLFEEDIFLLIAPRPLLGVRGERDKLFEYDLEFTKKIRQVYDTFGVSSAFKFVIEAGGHEYFVQPAIQFFKKHL